MKISLITGGAPHYEIGLVSGLVEQDLVVDVIGGKDLEAAPVMRHARVNFKNLHGKQAAGSPIWLKTVRVFRVYLRLMKYAATSDSEVVHIQWPYKLVFFDRTFLMLYYKCLGKKVIFTAHNVDGEARDGRASLQNRFSLKVLYRLSDHIIAHTEKMKTQLMQEFGVAESKVSVIPHGIMSAVPETAMDRAEARRRLGLNPDQRVLLAFGLVAPYKGLEYLVSALARLRQRSSDYFLVIAGRVKECPDYWSEVRSLIERERLTGSVLAETRHIPDESVEIYFKAADTVVMPYRSLFQSGVLFLAYRFGLPVIATDVGSIREDIVPGKTGWVCKVDDSEDLAQTIDAYFGSELFKDLENRRRAIREYAFARYSWSRIGEQTRKIYDQVTQNG
jgi:glycosyltransferase involved in cell wall biosynthesis